MAKAMAIAIAVVVSGVKSCIAKVLWESAPRKRNSSASQFIGPFSPTIHDKA